MDGELHSLAPTQVTTGVALTPKGTARIGDVLADAGPRMRDMQAGAVATETELGRAAPGAGVSDALLEPQLVAARDHRSTYGDMHMPVLSLVVLGLLLAFAWVL